MGPPKATFALSKATQKRLKTFAQRTGFTQSALVEQILNHGLASLEQRYEGLGQLLDEAFEGSEALRLNSASQRAELQGQNARSHAEGGSA